MSVITKERWIVTEGIPGIASKGEIIIVNPARGLLVSRWLPLARYADLILHRHHLSSPEPCWDEPMPHPRPARASLQLMD